MILGGLQFYWATEEILCNLKCNGVNNYTFIKHAELYKSKVENSEINV